MMEFSIDVESLEKNLTDGSGKIIHRSGNKIKLFPFPANDKKLKDVRQDLTSFKGIAGACFRECWNYSHKVSFEKQDFIEAVCAKAQAQDNVYLKDIVEKIAFDENDQLILFNLKVFPHLEHYVKNETLTSISKYLTSLLLDEENAQELKKVSSTEPDNLFHKLILSCLEEPAKVSPEYEPFYLAFHKIKQTFNQDLNTLIEDPDHFIHGFPSLLKFYYFIYVTNLSIQLNTFFDHKPNQAFLLS